LTGIGTLGIFGLIVIVFALVAWIFVVVRAGWNPTQTADSGGKLERGPVPGGAVRGDPGQSILTGQAPRQDDPEGENGRS
jgi:hypothetical protein